MLGSSSRKRAARLAAIDTAAREQAAIAAAEAKQKAHDAKVAKAKAAAKKKSLAAAKKAASTPQVTTVVTETKSNVDEAEFLADAARIGVNPVTLIRGGALSLYATNWSSVTETMTGHNALGAAQIAADAFWRTVPEDRVFQPIPFTPYQPAEDGSNWLSVAADAATAGFNVYMQDARLAQSQNFQRELLNLQLDRIGKLKAAGRSGGGFTIPPAVTSAGGSTKAQTADTSLFHVKKAGWTDPYPGSAWKTDPTMPDAETDETRYGELSGSIMGIGKLANDLVYNATGRSIPSFARSIDRGLNKVFGYGTWAPAFGFSGGTYDRRYVMPPNQGIP